MENKKWNGVLVDWVNCLKLGKNITNIDELRSGEFFANLQKVITKSRDVHQDTLSFIFDLFTKHYPNYIIDNKTEIHLADLPEIDLKAITSLLMHYTCIYDRKDVLTSPMCHSLPQSTQLIIRSFLQKITKEVTADAMNNAIKTCIDDAPDHTTGNQWLCVETSVKNSPLQDFLKTPVSKFGRLQEKDRLIAKLKSELETERYDKADLNEELKHALDKNKKIEQQLSQKTLEISRLRAEIVALENCAPPHCQDMDSRELQRRLRSEIQSLEQYIKQIEGEQDDIRKEKDAAKEQLRKIELQSSMWEEKFFETERNFESLSEHSKRQDGELRQLQVHCSELSAMLEEYKAKPHNDSSLFDTFTSIGDGKVLNETPPIEDLACSVVEVQLRDAQKLNDELRDQIGKLEAELRQKTKMNEDYCAQIETAQMEVNKAEKRLTELDKCFVEMKSKKQHLEVEIDSLTTKLEASAQSLHDIQKEKEELTSQVVLLQENNTTVEKQLSEMSQYWEVEKQKSRALENDLNDAKTVSEKLQFELADTVLENQKVGAQIETLKCEFQFLLTEKQEIERMRTILETHLLETQTYSQNLSTQLDKLRSENEELNEELVSREAQLTEARSEKSDFASKLKESHERINNLEKNNEKLITEMNELQNQLTDALNSLSLSQKRNQELEKNLVEAQSCSSSLETELYNLQLEKHEIVEELNASKASILNLIEEKSELATKLQQTEESRDSLVKENEEMLVRNEEVLKKLSTTAESLKDSNEQVQKLENSQLVLHAELSELRTSSETLRSQLDEMKHENQKVKSVLDATESKLHSSEEECCDLKENNKSLNLVVEDIQKQLLESRAAVEDLLGQMEEVKSILNRTEEECCNLKNKNEDLGLQFEDTQTRWSETREELKLSMEKVEDLESELKRITYEKQKISEELGDQVTKLVTEKEDLTSELEKSEEKCHDLKKNNENLNLQLEDRQKQLVETVALLETTRKQSQKLEESQSLLEKQLLESRATVEDLKHELEEMEEVKSILNRTEEECCNLKNKNEDLNLRFEDAQTRWSETREELKLSMEKVEDLESELKRITYEKQKISEELGDQVTKLVTEKEDLTSKLEKSEEKCHDLKKNNENLNLQLEDRQKQLVETVTLLETTRKQSQKLEESQSLLEKQLLESRATVEDLKHELEEMEEVKGVLNTTKEECCKLKKKNEDAQEELKLSTRKVEDLEAELKKISHEKQKIIEEVMTLVTEKEGISSKLEKSEEKSCDLKKNNENLNLLLEDTRKQLLDTVTLLEESREQSQKLETKNEDLALRFEDVQKRWSDAQADKQNVNEELGRAEDEATKLVAERDDLTSKLEKSEEKCNNLEEEIDKLQNLQKQLEEIRDQNEELTKDLAKSRQSVLQLEEENDDLLKKLTLKSKNLDKALNEVKLTETKKNDEAKRFKSDLYRLQAEKDDLISTIENLTKEKQTLQTRFNEERSNFEELLNRMSDSVEEAQFSKLKTNEDLLNLKNTNEFLMADVYDSEVKCVNLEDKCASLDEKLCEVVNNLLVSSKELEDVKKLNTTLVGDLTDLRFSYERLTSEKEETNHLINNLECCRGKYEDEVKGLRLKVKGLEETCQYFLAQYEEADIKIKSMEERLKKSEDLERDYKELKNNKETVDRQLDKMSELSETLKVESEELRLQFRKAKSDLEDIRNERDNLNQRLKELNEQHEILQKTNKENGDALAAALKQNEETEDGLRKKEQEVASMLEKIEKMGFENSDLEKKIEVEEIVSSETKEKVKALEDTIQDYEITISGLKKVVDSNLETLEALKEELSERKNKEIEITKQISELLQDGGDTSDFKTYVSENFTKLLMARNNEEQKRMQLEEEIEELKLKNNSAIEEIMSKLQALVMEQHEMVSMEALKSSFDKIHSKVSNILQDKQKLEAQNLALTKQFEDVSKLKSQLEEKVKLLETKSKPVKQEKENVLGVSTKGNKSREEELKKENMMLKRKIVLTENAKNNLEKVLKELREEKKKIKEEPKSQTNDALYKKLLDEYIQVKEENERVVKEKDAKIEELSRQVKIEDEKTLVQDLQNVREAYGNVVSVNSKLEMEIVTLRKKLEEYNTEKGNLAHIKEAYERLLEENNKFITEVDTLKYKRSRDKEEFVRLLKKEREENTGREMKKIQEIRSEYEGKLEKMKEKMLKLYREEVNKKVKSMKDGHSETATLMKTVANLRSELFEAEQKIQLLEMEREMLKSNKRFEPVRTVSSVTSTIKTDGRASTLPRPSVTEEITYSRRTSMGGIPPNPHNLQMEDEEDLFNDKYLTDLKEGRCNLLTDRESTTSRFSELAWRNTMVPPHLKSSYPAELQFVSPTRFKDEDIKTGNIEFEDSLCKLLPGEKPRKKDFGTTSYKKPGPPTPSKNGGRLSLQGNEVHPMREHCETKTPKKSTPSRLMAFLAGRNNSTRDNHESQSSVTPNRGRRLNIFRRPR